MAQHGKRYLTLESSSTESITPGRRRWPGQGHGEYEVDETIELTSTSAFDPRHSDQQVAAPSLPHGLGRPSACSFSRKVKTPANARKPAPTSSPTTK